MKYDGYGRLRTGSARVAPVATRRSPGRDGRRERRAGEAVTPRRAGPQTK
jgi:hypothetical protein